MSIQHNVKKGMFTLVKISQGEMRLQLLKFIPFCNRLFSVLLSFTILSSYVKRDPSVHYISSIFFRKGITHFSKEEWNDVPLVKPVISEHNIWGPFNVLFPLKFSPFYFCNYFQILPFSSGSESCISLINYKLCLTNIQYYE